MKATEVLNRAQLVDSVSPIYPELWELVALLLLIQWQQTIPWCKALSGTWMLWGINSGQCQNLCT